MLLNDKINFYGEFSIKTLDANDNVIDEYTDKNLIMNLARKNMAELVAGVTTAGADIGAPINRIVLGTRGHIGTDILNNILVGETDVTLGTFDNTRTQLFSEELNDLNYHVVFNPAGALDVTDAAAVGTMYTGTVAGTVDTSFNTVRRYTNGTGGNIVTYEITIPIDNGNNGTTPIAYTEAGLYSDTELFAMKTFPARVKEDTVKLIITWNIIF